MLIRTAVVAAPNFEKKARVSILGRGRKHLTAEIAEEMDSRILYRLVCVGSHKKLLTAEIAEGSQRTRRESDKRMAEQPVREV